MHIYYDHQCPNCEAPYVPYGKDVPCPKCGLVELKRFDFVVPAANSALANLANKGSFTPGTWFVSGIADNFLLHVFHALDFHKDERHRTFDEAAEFHFSRMEFGEFEFLRRYLVRLSIEIFEKISELMKEGWESRFMEKQQAATIRRKTDSERRSLPASATKQRLRESRPKNGISRRPDGSWLVYALADGRQVLYRDGEASYVILSSDGTVHRVRQCGRTGAVFE